MQVGKALPAPEKQDLDMQAKVDPIRAGTPTELPNTRCFIPDIISSVGAAGYCDVLRVCWFFQILPRWGSFQWLKKVDALIVEMVVSGNRSLSQVLARQKSTGFYPAGKGITQFRCGEICGARAFVYGIVPAAADFSQSWDGISLEIFRSSNADSLRYVAVIFVHASL